MKTLLIVRHAKSSWENPDLPDVERPLNKRGFRDAPFMAKLIAEKVPKPDLFLSSPATRAFTTAKYFAEAFEAKENDIAVKELIYDRGPKRILYMLSELSDDINSVALFGHNPDLSDLTHFLCDFEKGNLPTAAVVCIDFDINSWAHFGDDKGELRFFESPKMYFKKKKK